MSNFNKGLASDPKPQGMPDGFYIMGKNGLVRKFWTNEPGSLLLNAVAPYPVLGIIASDKHPIIFSGNGVNSAIGYLDTDNDAYIDKVNDASLPFKLGFKPGTYIIGQANRNYNDEVVVAFTDKNNKPPRYVNMDNPALNDEADLLLQPQFIQPNISLAKTTGGILAPGAWYAAVRYSRRDGTIAPFSEVSQVMIIPANETAAFTDVALQLTLTNQDNRYNFVEAVFIHKSPAGVVTPYLLDPVSMPAPVIIYNGTQRTEVITLEEILVAPVIYQFAEEMGQLNGELFIGTLTSTPPLRMQQYALKVRLKWKTQRDTTIMGSDRRTFMHEEVGAFYIRYELNAGGVSESFILAGPALTGDEIAVGVDTEAIAGGITTRPRFQTSPVPQSFNPVTNTGDFCGWRNANERYPDHPDFDASAIGGRNMRNQLVQHFRFPSIRWMKENVYFAEADYGRNWLDRLGIEVTGIEIPAQYAGIVTGYQILYAKRNPSNSLIVGQSIMVHSAESTPACTFTLPASTTMTMPTGGNWNSTFVKNTCGGERPLGLNRTLFRFHAFDMLFSRPAVSPTHFSFQLKLSRQALPATGGLIEDGGVTPGSKNGPLIYLLDYVTKGTSPTPATGGTRIRSVSNTRYTKSGTTDGIWNNTRSEDAFVGKLNAATAITPSLSRLDSQKGYTESWLTAQFEETILCNLIALKDDLYTNYNSQSLVKAGSAPISTLVATFWGGDTYVSDYSFHTTGSHDADDNGWNGTGIMVARRVLTQTAAFVTSRYELPGDVYTKYYPKSPLTYGDPNNYLLFMDRSINPNKFGYDLGFSALNDILSTTVYDPYRDYINYHPQRIHRAGKLSRQNKFRNWRTLLPLDYYECEKTYGKITGIQGLDDRLLIHHVNALFVTQSKTTLETDNLSVVLGSGSIFRIEPQPALNTPLGHGGSQHDLAAILTPAGYFFVDAKTGEIFIWKGELKNLNNLIHDFLSKELLVTETNTYMGNGITTGFDPEFKRLMVTAKRKQPIGPNKGMYISSQAFVNSLTVGDIVFRNGTWQRYLGLNTSGSYACAGCAAPIIIPHVAISVNVNTPVGTVIGTVSVTNHGNIFINSTAYPMFAVNPVTREIYTTTSMVPYYGVNFNVPFRDVNSCGADDEIIDIGIPMVGAPPPPDLPDGLSFQVDGTDGPFTGVVGTIPHNVAAPTYNITDITPSGTTFSIVSNVLSITSAVSEDVAFTLEQTSGSVTKEYPVVIEVLTAIPEPNDTPVTIEINNLTPENTVIGRYTPLSPSVYAVVFETIPGMFRIDAEGQITVGDNLTAGIHVFTIAVTNTAGIVRAVDITITVLHARQTLRFRPLSPACTGVNVVFGDIEIYSTLESRVLAVVPNAVSVAEFEGVDNPYFAPQSNHIACGGISTSYYNATKTVIGRKNDCVVPGYGLPLEYTVVSGYFVSLVSQVAADALVDADITANAQIYFNANGTCLNEPL